MNPAVVPTVSRWQRRFSCTSSSVLASASDENVLLFRHVFYEDAETCQT